MSVSCFSAIFRPKSNQIEMADKRNGQNVSDNKYTIIGGFTHQICLVWIVVSRIWGSCLCRTTWSEDSNLWRETIAGCQICSYRSTMVALQKRQIHITKEKCCSWQSYCFSLHIHYNKKCNNTKSKKQKTDSITKNWNSIQHIHKVLNKDYFCSKKDRH